MIQIGESVLLDYFAGQALAGILAGRLNQRNSFYDYQDVARVAYQYAHALMHERAKMHLKQGDYEQG